MANYAVDTIGSCARLCCDIIELLAVAKHNKKECQSLATSVRLIGSFVNRIRPETVSTEGGTALGGTWLVGMRSGCHC